MPESHPSLPSLPPTSSQPPGPAGSTPETHLHSAASSPGPSLPAALVPTLVTLTLPPTPHLPTRLDRVPCLGPEAGHLPAFTQHAGGSPPVSQALGFPRHILGGSDVL